MKWLSRTHRTIMPTMLLILAGLISGTGSFQVWGQRIVRFSGSATNAREGVDSAIRIDLLRWSTPEEREAALEAINTNGQEGFGDLVGEAQTLGYVWTAESAGYSVRYAHHFSGPAGTERVVIATDGRVGSRNPLLWDAIDYPGAPDSAFTLIELRLGPAGQGEARAALAAGVLVETDGPMLGLEGYESAPVLMENVTKEES